ncbi:UDP-N-acetylglucosamine 2-epimerase (non-hydrolyzing) [Deltaproteobacteria bacterium Smac51]|nr:UDP-N-acetylglucosamine 2-epimerase (non-hydrolyzing) [Deltaproteobacteria bacterium Smac51]
MKKIIVILGTRPEAIKLAPVILQLRQNPKYRILVCNTEQQKEISNQALGFFGIKADFNLNVMLDNQTLPGLQSLLMSRLAQIYSANRFDATIVQGDTATVLGGALTSFYNKIPLFHVEAGLRSYKLNEPFPEEAIRQMVARIADLHFAPTEYAKDVLIKENIDESRIFVTGNTVIDALMQLSNQSVEDAEKSLKRGNIILNDKLVLITVHRRENHGVRLEQILEAIAELAKMFSDHQFVLPVHPNPNVKNRIYEALDSKSNIVLTEPLDYPELVCLMKNSKLVLTDSGGIQEEAPTFGNPVLVMRLETERKEIIDAGFAKLVGADKMKIIREAGIILSRDRAETRLDGSKSPYGQGNSSIEIERIINAFFYCAN